MIDKKDIFTKSVDIYALMQYLTERQFELEGNAISITIEGVVLNPEALTLVIMDEKVRSIGVDNHKLAGIWKLYASNSLKFDEMRLVIY